jgi:hypothetical protein
VAEPGYTPPEKATADQIRKFNERLRQLERPTGSQNNRNKDKVEAALKDLQKQATELEEQANQQQETLDYLSSLKTYSAADNGQVGNFTGGPISHGETTPSINFTLEETMKVRITLRANASLYASGASSQTITANARMKIILDGTARENEVANAFLYQAIPPANGNHGASADSQLVSEVVTTLAAGDHSAVSNYATNGDGASVNVTITNRSMTVQVLGRP